jgi:hypothetical protein
MLMFQMNRQREERRRKYLIKRLLARVSGPEKALAILVPRWQVTTIPINVLLVKFIFCTHLSFKSTSLKPVKQSGPAFTLAYLSARQEPLPAWPARHTRARGDLRTRVSFWREYPGRKKRWKYSCPADR